MIQPEAAESPESTSERAHERFTELVVTNVDSGVFFHPDATEIFEGTFREIDKHVTFVYIRQMNRARLQFSSYELAWTARLKCDGLAICGQIVRCVFVMPTSSPGSGLLQPPKPSRLFLRSPPASPPIGWEPPLDDQPVINYELLEAIEKMKPGQSLELLPPTPSAPAVIVDLCENVAGVEESGSQNGSQKRATIT